MVIMLDFQFVLFVVIFGFILLVYPLLKLCCLRKTRAQRQVQLTFTQEQAQAQAQNQAHSQVQSEAHYQHQEQQEKEHKGLDQETIDSYPTVEVGEMRHLDDDTCPICLTEYNQGDILKVLPECVHGFHRDCLVEWLKLDATCPICRTHPPRFTPFVS